MRVKVVIKQQILMYKIAVYRLVDGGIKNGKCPKKVILRGSTLTLKAVLFVGCSICRTKKMQKLPLTN